MRNFAALKGEGVEGNIVEIACALNPSGLASKYGRNERAEILITVLSEALLRWDGFLGCNFLK